MSEIKFETMRNGYNRYQVDDKISQLTDEIETLQKKLTLYSNRLDEVEKQSAAYKEKYLTLAGEIRIKEKAASLREEAADRIGCCIHHKRRQSNQPQPRLEGNEGSVRAGKRFKKQGLSA